MSFSLTFSLHVSPFLFFLSIQVFFRLHVLQANDGVVVVGVSVGVVAVSIDVTVESSEPKQEEHVEREKSWFKIHNQTHF